VRRKRNNWKTTLAGLALALTTLMNAEKIDTAAIIQAAAAAALGVLAKDANQPTPGSATSEPTHKN
jgi:hypothetical protein